jgi:predicted nuclease of predicted toxin-antitoxin system
MGNHFVVWEFARERNPVIVTRDANFSDPILISTPPPAAVGPSTSGRFR